MTDLELCKRIAVIDGVELSKEVNDLTGNYETTKPPYMSYNPLTDDALCFQLMINYEIKVSTYYKIGDHKAYYSAENPNFEEFEARTPNKAILLAIIEAHNNG